MRGGSSALAYSRWKSSHQSARENDDAREADKPQEVLDVPLVARHETPEVLQPGEEPLNLPPTAVAA
jgi:hypothetical protein